MFKKQILYLLEYQTKRFLAKHKPKIVAITGSVGKTSTKFAIATVLSQRYKVLVHQGNHNTHYSVPLAILDVPYPDNIRDPFAWLGVLWQMNKKIQQPLEYEVLVLELGTDQPGDIAGFSRYLQPDIAVVTAVSAEHMEFFGTIDAVAKEELTVTNFSKLAIINRDNIDALFAKYMTNTNIDTYGTSGIAEYHYVIEDFTPGTGFRGKMVSPEYGEQVVALKLVGEHNTKAAVAAVAVGAKMGLNAKQIVDGVQQIIPAPGRMNLLRGLNDSLLIDDTYNSSPLAAIAALQTLYLFPTAQRIVIMGSMNELGDYSKQAHEEVGHACDPGMLDWVVTIGEDAEKFLAPAAASRGCQVRSFASPYDAGSFVHSVLHKEAVVLAKGSQNRVFAEEALKMLLHSTEEESKLVRQSHMWLAKKATQFEKIKAAID